MNRHPDAINRIATPLTDCLLPSAPVGEELVWLRCHAAQCDNARQLRAARNARKRAAQPRVTLREWIASPAPVWVAVVLIGALWGMGLVWGLLNTLGV